MFHNFFYFWKVPQYQNKCYTKKSLFYFFRLYLPISPYSLKIFLQKLTYWGIWYCFPSLSSFSEGFEFLPARNTFAFFHREPSVPYLFFSVFFLSSVWYNNSWVFRKIAKMLDVTFFAFFIRPCWKRYTHEKIEFSKLHL